MSTKLHRLTFFDLGEKSRKRRGEWGQLQASLEVGGGRKWKRFTPTDLRQRGVQRGAGRQDICAKIN